VLHIEQKDEVVNIVIEFISRMNLWETQMYYLSRIRRGEYVKQELYEKYKDLDKQKLFEEYKKIIEDTCTQRERVYGGNPETASYGKPPKYNGINETTIVESTLVKPDRIEVVAKGGNSPDMYVKFVLFKKNGKWRIDNLLVRFCDAEWIRAYI